MAVCSLEISHRILRLSVYSDLEVKVRSCRVSCRAHSSYRAASADAGALAYGHRGQMRIGGYHASSVGNQDKIPVASRPSGKDNHAAIGGPYGGAFRSGNVDSGMKPAPPHAESRCHRARDRPEKPSRPRAPSPT